MSSRGKWIAAGAAGAAVVAVLAMRGCDSSPPPAPQAPVAVAPSSQPAAPSLPAPPPTVAQVEPERSAAAPEPVTPVAPPRARITKKKARPRPAASTAAAAPAPSAEGAPPAAPTDLAATPPATPPATVELARSLPPAEPPEVVERPRLGFGLQAGFVAPAGSDLSTTTGFPVSGSIGLHAAWRPSPRHTLRPRIDAALFWEGRQSSDAPSLSQRLTTRVSSVGLGADYLLRLGGEGGRVAVGAHLAAIRWAVRTTSTVSVPGAGSSIASGTASWWRPGGGPVCEYLITRRLSAEARLVFSSYGHETVAAHTASLGLLWSF